jgi:hypothetical protein
MPVFSERVRLRKWVQIRDVAGSSANLLDHPTVMTWRERRISWPIAATHRFARSSAPKISQISTTVRRRTARAGQNYTAVYGATTFDGRPCLGDLRSAIAVSCHDLIEVVVAEPLRFVESCDALGLLHAAPHGHVID